MNYNKTKEYNHAIKQKVDELILECRKENLPCFITVAVSNSENKTEYISNSVTPYSINLNLKNDKISQHINVLNGFKTVPYTNLYDDNSKIEHTEEDEWGDVKMLEPS